MAVVNISIPPKHEQVQKQLRVSTKGKDAESSQVDALSLLLPLLEAGAQH